jgi:hypothetical protein
VPSRSHLTRPKPRNAQVDLGDGDVLNITFDANKITPAWLREAKVRDDEQDSYSLPKALADVLLGWDVTEDDGSAFPPIAENIGQFSYPVQSELLTSILTAAVPASEEGNVSSAPSLNPLSASMEIQPSSAPNGATSPSPTPSASPSPT